MATDSSRIVIVSALAHQFVKELDVSNLNFTREKTGEKFFEIYSVTKLCNLLFTRELAKRLKNAGMLIMTI
jgi:retinol dehydrogenase 12